MTKLGYVMVVDDEVELRTALCETLDNHGYETTAFGSGTDALTALQKQEFDLILLDLMMLEMDGIEFLKKAIEIDPDVVGIIMTGYGSIQTAVEAMKLGAFDYLLKPFKLNMLLQVMSRAMEMRRLKNENLHLRESMAIYNLIMNSTVALDINVVLNKIADSVIEQCEADEMSIMLPTKTGELYVAIARGEDRIGILGERIPITQGIAGWVYSNRETVLLPGQINDARFAPTKPRSEIKSFISMPLLLGGNCVGVLNVNLLKKSAFPIKKTKALNLLASTIASVLENARLYSELMETEKNYRSIFENAIEGIFQVARNGCYMLVNPSMARILGYDKPEEVVSLASGVDYLNLFEGCTEIQGIERQISRKDGTLVWVSENARAVRDDNGHILYFEGTSLDITKRKNAETALRQSEEKFSKAFHGSPIMMALATVEEEEIIDANEAFCNALGYTRAEIIGYSTSKIEFCREQGNELEHLDILFKNGRIENAPINLYTKTGEIRYVLCWSQSLTLDAKACHLTACIDITDQKAMQREFEKLDRLNLIGQMAASIGHEIRNPMTAIRGFLQMLSIKDCYANDLMYFELMIEELDRANSIISEYLGMARNKPVDLTPQHVDSIVISLYPIIKADANYQEMDVILDLGNPSMILIDEKEIRQMILNLVRNGLEAMLPGRKITISTVEQGEEVILHVKDEGPGLDPKVLDMIGTPFLTTKENGTGLGLAVCYSIAARHNARIEVETGSDGTTFSIHFPQVIKQMELF